MTDQRLEVDGTEKRAALSRELSEFLIELSIGVHRYAMYPPGHPSLEPVVENIIGRLAELFEARRRLAIGVARRQLVIEGVATDSKHPVLSDLAYRLHDHQIGSLSFTKGTRGTEIEGLLETLAGDTEREVEPLGFRDREDIPTWEHIKLYPVGYDRIEMQEDGEEEPDPGRALQLWLGLAQSALQADEPVDDSDATDPRKLARIIEQHRDEEAYDQVIVGYLLQLAEELRGDGGGESEKIRKRVSRLIEDMDESALARLVELGGNRSQRQRLLLDANHSLAVDSVMKLVKAAARVQGQDISTSMTRLLTKLSAHAGSGSGRLRSQADTALRENVENLMADWKLEDPNPGQYSAVLDGMARASPVFAERIEREEELSGAQRILQMALEVDAWGPTVEQAVADLLDQGQSRFLLELIESAPGGSGVAEKVRENLADPGRLRRLLSGEDVAEQGLQSLVQRMGSAAIPPLLEVLAESDSRSVRRKVFDVLSTMGSEVGEQAVDRLEDRRWFVLRNMLALLQRLDEVPERFDPLPLTRHPDHRVRREAFVLAVRDGSLRERTLAAALVENDERLVRMSLLEVEGDVTRSLIPVLVNRVVRSDHPPEIRALGIRVLRGVRSTLVKDALLEVAVAGKSLFGKTKVADPTPDVLAALAVLADTWTDDPEVQELIKVAGRSKNPEIRAAVGASA